jgi:hypothetical protein
MLVECKETMVYLMVNSARCGKQMLESLLYNPSIPQHSDTVEVMTKDGYLMVVEDQCWAYGIY